VDFLLLVELGFIFALGTYVQTATGFGLGMIIMGAVTIFGLLPIAFTSVVISLMTLSNGVFAIKGNSKALNLKLVAYTCAGLVPGIALGLFILNYMSAQMNNTLQLLLGVAIMLGASTTLLKPEPSKQVSRNWSFALAGKLAGLLAGLFSVAGPPLVYQFYRQPLDNKTIRLCLILIFLISSVIRTSMVGLQGGLEFSMFSFALCTVPIVYVATWLGKNCPPPLSALNMRRFAISLLLILGASLIVKSISVMLS
jgi:uncharacterized membrane protein YfcA